MAFLVLDRKNQCLKKTFRAQEPPFLSRLKILWKRINPNSELTVDMHSLRRIGKNRHFIN
jgi:hypothetical protein